MYRLDAELASWRAGWTPRQDTHWRVLSPNGVSAVVCDTIDHPRACSAWRACIPACFVMGTCTCTSVSVSVSVMSLLSTINYFRVLSTVSVCVADTNTFVIDNYNVHGGPFAVQGLDGGHGVDSPGLDTNGISEWAARSTTPRGPGSGV